MSGSGLGPGRGALGDEVPEGAGRHALLAEAGQDVGDVGQIGLVGADEQHATAAGPEAGVGVEEIRGAVQGDDGLARARAAVDDERALEPARMMASWSAWMVPSTSRIRADRLLPRAAMKADWSSSAACPSNPSIPPNSSRANTSSQ